MLVGELDKTFSLLFLDSKTNTYVEQAASSYLGELS